ncbi:hypothetical protein [Thermocatellispora tengchongensis]
MRFCQYSSQACWSILMRMPGLAFWKASAHCWYAPCCASSQSE